MSRSRPRKSISSRRASTAMTRIRRASICRRRRCRARSLWSGDDAANARGYFAGGMVALPAFRPELVLDLVHSSGTWRMLEPYARPDLQQVTPGLATISAVAAIEACHLHPAAQAEIDRC